MESRCCQHSRPNTPVTCALSVPQAPMEKNVLRHPGRLRCGDAVDLDVEATWPRRDIDEDPRRWILGKIPGIDRVHDREFIDPGSNGGKPET
jgi:hypothetical protein